MFDAASPAMAAKVIELGDGGDGVSARFCLARTVGLRRGQPVELDLPAIAARSDLGAAAGAVAAAVADGTITPEEAAHLARMLDGFPRILAAAPPPAPGSDDDPREILIRELDRLASRIPKEERRARLLEELAALDAEEPAGSAALRRLYSPVAEDQEQDQHDQQQPADPDPAAIAIG